MDKELLARIQERRRSEATHTVMRSLGWVGEHGAVWILIGGSMAVVDRRRRWGWAGVAIGAPASIGINLMIKNAVKRPRPDLGKGPHPSVRAGSYSFPSAHATSSLTAATLASHLDRRAAVGMFGLAGVMAASRSYIGAHYVGDVLVGAGLGFAFGKLAGRALPQRESRGAGV